MDPEIVAARAGELGILENPAGEALSAALHAAKARAGSTLGALTNVLPQTRALKAAHKAAPDQVTGAVNDVLSPVTDGFKDAAGEAEGKVTDYLDKAAAKEGPLKSAMEIFNRVKEFLDGLMDKVFQIAGAVIPFDNKLQQTTKTVNAALDSPEFSTLTQGLAQALTPDNPDMYAQVVTETIKENLGEDTLKDIIGGVDRLRENALHTGQQKLNGGTEKWDAKAAVVGDITEDLFNAVMTNVANTAIAQGEDPHVASVKGYAFAKSVTGYDLEMNEHGKTILVKSQDVTGLSQVLGDTFASIDQGMLKDIKVNLADISFNAGTTPQAAASTIDSATLSGVSLDSGYDTLADLEAAPNTPTESLASTKSVGQLS